MYSNLTSFACIRIYGPDCQKFLQSQLTNDISLLEKTNEQSAAEMNRSQLTAYCNPKGRVISLMKICRKNNDEYFIIAPFKSYGNTIKKRFTLYKLRADVHLSDETDENTRFWLLLMSMEMKILTLNLRNLEQKPIYSRILFIIIKEKNIYSLRKNSTQRRF